MHNDVPTAHEWAASVTAVPPSRPAAGGSLDSVPASKDHRPGTAGLVVLLTMVHAPFSILFGIVPSIYQYSGSVGVPLVLGLAGGVMMVFSISLAAMSRHIVQAGGLYAMVAAGLGPAAGLAAAAVGLVSYLGFLSTGQVVVGSAFSALANLTVGSSPPAWLCVLVAAVLNALLAQLRVRTIVRGLAVVGVFLVAGVTCLDIAAIAHPAGGFVSLAAVEPASLWSGSFMVAVVLASFTFAGSELGPSFADDVSTPDRSIGRATALGYLIVTIVLVVSTWSISVALGPENAVAAARGSLQGLTGSQGQPMILDVAVRVVGAGHARSAFIWLTVGLVASSVAVCLVRTVAVSRQLAALARGGAVPAALGRSLVVPAIAGAGSMASVWLGGDRAILYLGAITSLGITMLITLVAVAIVCWFLRSEEEETDFLGWEMPVIAGAFTAVTCGFISVYSLFRLPDVFGPDASIIAWLLPAATLGAAVVGLIWAFVLRARNSPALSLLGRSSLPSRSSWLR